VTLALLGIDPGGRESGVVLRRRDDLLAYEYVVRRDDGTYPDGRYCSQVAAACLRVLDRGGLGPRSDGLVVVVEGVRYWARPDAPRNLTGVLGAAIVLGSILARWSDAVVVPPGSGHGSLHEQAYPEEIRPPADGRGRDRLRHCRSAFDVTIHGETLYNQRRREQSSIG
jgi:hypothetical protein